MLINYLYIFVGDMSFQVLCPFLDEVILCFLLLSFNMLVFKLTFLAMGVAALLDNWVGYLILVRQLTVQCCMEKIVFSLNMSKKLVRYPSGNTLKGYDGSGVLKKKRARGGFIL